ncbi:MAG: TldD/PmbA family protein [Weeping tea tree witches'-broom phytoplasma]|uniref:TldD/PmbA family protein n=1 Tax=Candidatus Phytoplasma melaleucae TaxID=2982630 RepID=UPI00293AB1A0|nr:TldD/PmbA family protein [Weeping tea tree witches'-broom phytoplasma]
MLSKKEIQDLLTCSLDAGIDFAEFFFEDSVSYVYKVIDQEVVFSSNSYIYGVGIRLLKHTNEIYIYTNKVNYKNILDLIMKQKKFFCDKQMISAMPLNDSKMIPHNLAKSFECLSLEEKVNKMLLLSQTMKMTDSKIIQTIVNLEEKEQKILIANSKGLYQNDFRPYIRLSLTAVAQDNGIMQEFTQSFGRSMGLEFFDIIDTEKESKQVALQAVELLLAKELKPQIMPVIINNGSGGVIFHEACGHSLEATAIARNLSPFCNKINHKIASEVVSAYDDGTISGFWGKLNFDDEGTPTQKNTLIRKGILENYLVDFRNSRKLNMKVTGSGRRQSYKYSPTSRMNSTYIAAGDDTPEQIIRDTSYGLYAKTLGGGTVDTNTGEFNFMVNSGYLIENGKLTIPVKGMMLIGKGQDVLLKIDRVANDLCFTQGYCGSISGYVPVDLGQPTIRVTEMIVGGSKKE